MRIADRIAAIVEIPVFSAIVLAAVASAACYDETKPLPPYYPDYPPAPPFLGDIESACSSACANLRRLGCPEGSGAISGETCERRCKVAMELRAMPLACWTAAETVAAAKGCGSLRCVR